VKFLRKGGQAGFIGDGQKSAGDCHKISLSRWGLGPAVPASANPVTNPPPPGKRNRRGANLRDAVVKRRAEIGIPLRSRPWSAAGSEEPRRFG
jgi:hypothetical protein